MSSLARRKKLTKKQHEQRRRIFIGTLLVSVAFLMGLIFGNNDLDLSAFTSYNEWSIEARRWFGSLSRPGSSVETDQASIHFFDVGQGSATLLQADDGTNILIDTGRYDDSNQRIMTYLDQYIGIGGKIDLLIFTHSDADHIGHGDLVMEYYDVAEVWMNGMDNTTVIYERVLDALLDSDAEYVEPKAGEEYEIGSFWVEVLHPLPNETMRDQNEESIVTRITVNNVSFMTSGDASQSIENRIIQETGNLASEILLVGHHGSSYSTGENWLNALNPEIAIYQAGEENAYGHPHDELIDRLETLDVPLYGTPEYGNISIFIDENGDYLLELEGE